ncbi:activating transcription factor 7-interacting protein 2 isoform X2 [Hyposmocoma kahamanoa]|uniref:activating transcription factor 7-interacting protein 2 isoform X2 n=1 Tax=Hyposmocoma kahamanoa TaxID=1477025 RepID=UPI000E6D6F6A|nr:activating transcription factor 7-interacting protein 2 isoform X2 [Hyposmocoma kahamanoa]
MQLIVNTESTDTEKMSTIEQESLIEKPFINGSQEMNDVIKAIDDQEIPIANKENIQVEENKIINIYENRHPAETPEVKDDDKISVHTKEEAKKSIDDAAVTDEDCKQLTDSTEHNCSVIKNGTENVTHEIDENKSQNNSVEKDEGSKIFGIIINTQNNAATENNAVKDENKNDDDKDENKNDDDTVVKGIKPVKDTQSHEETEIDDLKEKKNIEGVDVEHEAKVIISEVDFNEVKEKNSEFKQTLQENSHASITADESETIPQKAANESSEAISDLGEEFPSTCPNDGDSVRQEIAQISTIDADDVHSIREIDSTIISSGDNSNCKETSVHAADIRGEITQGDSENTEMPKEMLDPGDVITEIITEENNPAQLTEDVEMVSTECKINDIADVKAEEKSEYAQTAEHVEVVDLQDKNKDDADIQGIIQMDISENGDKTTIQSSRNGEIDDVDKNKDDSYSQVTTVSTVDQNENKDTSTKNMKIDTVKDKNSEIKNESNDVIANTVNDIVDLDEVKIVEDDRKEGTCDKKEVSRVAQKVEEKIICTTTIRLSNTLDILSDDDEEPPKTISPEPSKVTTEQIVDENPDEKSEKPKPLIPDNFFKTFKKNLAEMTRDDLEEFCILKIVESVVERSNLNDTKSKLKTMALGIEEYKKKAMMLTKQNRDLQVVLKSIQEELKKKSGTAITPLKITRSVGMQVIMPDKNRRKGMVQNTGASPNTNAQTNVNNNTNRPQRNSNQNQRLQKQASTVQSIPVPRLVPATNTNVTNKPAQPSTTNNAKAATSLPNGAKNAPVTQKAAEKRAHSRVQSVTVDLTDDEPPAKQTPKNSPVPPVRLIPSQNLLSTRQQFTQNSPRKVYIPISGPQAQNIRPGQAVMLKNVSPSPAPRANRPPMVRLPQSSVRSGRGPNSNRHPAPLPDAMKQYQPPNWKALPPAPDLKLSKVENGIVISWKIDGYQDDSYEEIASYQLYAYQETSTPPNTALWKKIGDVKALPLPMACTLTQFMAGYKYYFAVRAVDIRSRVGPFSLPGSILLLNKM